MRCRLITLAFVLCIGAGPALADRDHDESGEGHGHKGKHHEKHEKHEEHDGDSYFHRHGYQRLSIPKGHYPPPGMCRAWFPDRPPGHQPRAQRCDAPVPRGAWLIENPRGGHSQVRITVYDWNTPPPPPVVVREVAPPPPTVVYREVAVAPRPVALPPVLAVGEFNIADGVLVHVVVH